MIKACTDLARAMLSYGHPVGSEVQLQHHKGPTGTVAPEEGQQQSQLATLASMMPLT